LEAQGSSNGRTLTLSVWSSNVDSVAFAFALLQIHYVGNGIELEGVVAHCGRIGPRPSWVEAKRGYCRTMRPVAFHVMTAIHMDLQGKGTVTGRVVAKVDAII